MSYCRQCGAYVPDWAEECPACGEPKEAPKKRAASAKKSAASAAAAAARAEKNSGEYHYKYRREADDTQSPRGGDTVSSGSYDASARRYAKVYKADAGQHRGLAALCYFGPFFLLSWLLQPKSDFVRYHVNQGLVLFLLWIVLGVMDFIPFMWVLNILGVVCMISGIFNALGGKRKPMPLIGEIYLIK